MTEIVITEFMEESTIRAAFGDRDVIYDPTLVDHPERLHTLLSDCRALIVRNRTQVRGDLLTRAPLLRVIGRLGVGLDNIDVAACEARGIAVRPATGANDLAVAEYVITAALLLLRRSWFASERVAQGHWPRMESIGRELAGKRLGLIGFGAIARLTASKAAALGMTLAAFDPWVPADHVAWKGVECLSLEALLTTSDVVSLHTPLTKDTRRMIDAVALARMKSNAILINAARGGIVDEVALAAVLKAGQLAGAALDVFETEPLTLEAAQSLRDAPNLILTPHIAGVTAESNVRVSAVTARSVLEVLSLSRPTSRHSRQ